MSCRFRGDGYDDFYLGRRFGVEVAESLAKYFVQLRICSSEPVSIKQLTQAQSIEQPKLAEAIELMQSNLEEPLTTDDLSHHVQISGASWSGYSKISGQCALPLLFADPVGACP